jgi:hypothetical protein
VPLGNKGVRSSAEEVIVRHRNRRANISH